MEGRTQLQQAIIAALGAEGSPLRRQGAELVVDHVLSLPLGQLVDADFVAPLLIDALSEGNVARAVERHVLPGIERVRRQLDDADEKVGDALPEAVRARIVQLASNPSGPRFRWMRGALDAARVRDLLAPVVQETLLQFVRTVPGMGGASGADGDEGRPRGGGLVGRLGREVQKSTGRLVSMGRSVADGLGVDLDRRIQDTARDFSQGAMAGLQRGLRERMASDAGRQILEGLSTRVAEHVFATPVEDIMRDLDRLPLVAAVELAPATIAHVLSRELGRAALDGEVRAYFELEGRRSLQELLDEAGLLHEVRAHAIERAEASGQSLFAGELFAGWLAAVLEAAGVPE